MNHLSNNSEFKSLKDITNKFPENSFSDETDEELVLKIFNQEINESEITDEKYLNVYAMYYMSYDKYNDAKLILEKCISDDSNDVSDSQRKKTLLNYASCLQHENNFDESIDIYKSLIEKYKYVDAMHNIANIYKDKKEHEEAIKYYEMAIKNGLNISYYSLGLVYLSLNKFDKAIEIFKIGVEKNIIYCMFSLGVYYSVINNEEEMLKYFTMAVNFGDGRNTISRDAIIKLIKYYTKINNIEKINHYKNILREKFPDSYEALIACEEFYKLSQEQE